MSSEYKKTVFQGVFYYESKNKKFQGKPVRCFHIKIFVNGKQKKEKIGWLSEGYSAKYANKIRNERIRAGRHPEFENDKKAPLLFSEAVEKYIEHIKTYKKSWRDDSYKFEYFKGKFSTLNIYDIKTANIQNIKTELSSLKAKGKKTTLAPETVKKYIIVLRELFNWLIDTDQYKGENPATFKKIKFEKYDNTVVRFLKQDEEERLLRVLEEYKDQQVADMIRLAMWTGLRRTHVFKICWDDINFENKVLKFFNKPQEYDYIPLNSKAIDILQRQKKKIDNPHVFPGRVNERWHRIDKHWKKIKEAAGIPAEFRFHDLRHHFASKLVASGVEMYKVQKILTHKDPMMTQCYAHLKMEDLLEASERGTK